MKRKQWFTALAVCLALFSLTLSVLALPRATERDTDGSLIDDAESILDTLESDLLPDKEDGTVTSTPAETPATNPLASESTAMEEDGGSALALVIGISVAVIVLIIVFVILSRSATKH